MTRLQHHISSIKRPRCGCSSSIGTADAAISTEDSALDTDDDEVDDDKDGVKLELELEPALGFFLSWASTITSGREAS